MANWANLREGIDTTRKCAIKTGYFGSLYTLLNIGTLLFIYFFKKRYVPVLLSETHPGTVTCNSGCPSTD